MDSKPRPTTENRQAFFNEEGEMLPPFRLAGWRGCALDRDMHDNRRIDKSLFESIIIAAETSSIFVCGYFKSGELCTKINADWHTYSDFLSEEKNWSVEYVIFSEQRNWAILSECDVTVIGAEKNVATKLDSILNSQGRSLVDITSPLFDGENPIATAYFRAISGVL
jgi:hypothetical protein